MSPMKCRLMMDQTLKINGDELFMKTNVLNITFAGIESDLLTMMVDTPLDGAIQMPFDKFGWFYDVSILTCKRFTSYLMAI